MSKGGSKKQTIGYKYYLGVHFALCHGQIDGISKITIADKDAYSAGKLTDQSSTIRIYAPELFGGKKREGGVDGYIDILNGSPTQPQNSYLMSRLGSLIPAFRGVAGIVLKGMYIGNNPYLKAWSIKPTRITKTSEGLDQWYLDKCQIINTKLSAKLLDETFTNLDAWGLESGTLDSFSIVSDEFGNALKITGNQYEPISRVARIFSPPSDWDVIRLKFKIGSYEAEDCGVFDILDEFDNLIFNFTPVRDVSVDPLRRAHLSFLSGDTGLILSDGVLDTNVWYELFLKMNRQTGALSGSILEISKNKFVKISEGLSLFSYAKASKIIFRNETVSSNAGESYWDDIQVMEASSDDMNPSHIIRECLTDKVWGMGYNDLDIDNDSFILAANTLFHEQFGISKLWLRESSIEDFITDILQHIEGTLYVSRVTGKFVLKLARNDYNVDDLLTLDETNISSVSSFKRKTVSDLANQVTISYIDNLLDKNNSITVQNLALVQQQGVTISESFNYDGISNGGLASKIAFRELKTVSSPLFTCTLYTNRVASALNVGDVFKLNWPRYGITNSVMRVSSIEFGDITNNSIRIDCIQDTFGISDVFYSTPVDSEWTNPSSDPIDIPYVKSYEAPYYMIAKLVGDAEASGIEAGSGYLIVNSASPTNDAFNFKITTYTSEWEDWGEGDFSPTAVTIGSLGITDYSVEINAITGIDLDQIDNGTLAIINNEFIRIDTINLTSDGNYLLTISRGCLDTVRTTHLTGSRIFFVDTTYNTNAQTYIDGETVDIKLLTTTPKGILDQSSATLHTVSFDSRKDRPHPPAKVQINGSSYPTSINEGVDLVLSWAHRNRLQQTGPIIDDLQNSITPEAGTLYDVKIYDSTNTLITSVIDINDVTTTITSATLGLNFGDIKIKLWSHIGTLVSWQTHEFTINRIDI